MTKPVTPPKIVSPYGKPSPTLIPCKMTPCHLTKRKAFATLHNNIMLSCQDIDKYSFSPKMTSKTTCLTENVTLRNQPWQQLSNPGNKGGTMNSEFQTKNPTLKRETGNMPSIWNNQKGAGGNLIPCIKPEKVLKIEVSGKKVYW